MQAVLIPFEAKKQKQLAALGYSFDTDRDSAQVLIISDTSDKEAGYWEGYYKALKKDVIIIEEGVSGLGYHNTWQEFIDSHNKPQDTKNISKEETYEKIIRYLATALFSYMGEANINAKGDMEFYVNGDMVTMFRQTYGVWFDFEPLAKDKEQMHVKYTPKK